MERSYSYLNKAQSSIQSNPLYFALSGILQIAVVAYILYKVNPYNVSTKYPSFVLLFVLSFTFIQIIQFLFIREKTQRVGKQSASSMISFNQFTLYSIVSILFLFFVGWVVHSLVRSFTKYGIFGTLFTQFIHVIIGLCIITLLYLAYKFIGGYFIDRSRNPTDNSIGALFGTVFAYIPCLVLKLVDFIKYQFAITTSPTWIVLGGLVLFTGLKYAIPPIYSRLVLQNGVPIYMNNSLEFADKPFYLDYKYTVGSYDILHKQSTEKKYKYSLSYWLWIDAQPPSTRKSYLEYANLIHFGGQPKVEYQGLENKLRITYELFDEDISLNVDPSTSASTRSRILTLYDSQEQKDTIHLQRWNHMVLNYDSGTMDVFMNGELISSTPGISPYLKTENLTIGQDNPKGISGYIHKIMYYYNEVLTQRDIQWMYLASRDQISLPRETKMHL